MGGTSLNNGESLYFGNYELYVGDTTVEFIVHPAYYNDYGDLRINLMNTDEPFGNSDNVSNITSDFAWICSLPEGNEPFFTRDWWLNILDDSE